MTSKIGKILKNLSLVGIFAANLGFMKYSFIKHTKKSFVLFFIISSTFWLSTSIIQSIYGIPGGNLLIPIKDIKRPLLSSKNSSNNGKNSKEELPSFTKLLTTESKKPSKKTAKKPPSNQKEPSKGLIEKVHTKFQKWLGVNQSQNNPIWLYIIFIVLFLGFYVGYNAGLLLQLVFWIGINIFPVLVSYIKNPIDNFLLILNIGVVKLPLSFVSSIILLVIFFYILTMINNLLRFVLKVTFLSHFNSLLGAFLGISLACVGLGCLLFWIETIGISLTEDMPFYEELKFITKKLLGESSLNSFKELL